MTIITLPADLEAKLVAEAQRRGATVEAVAVEQLRVANVAQGVAENGSAEAPAEKGQASPDDQTMYDFLEGFIGTVEGPPDLSKETGRQFTELLIEQDERKRAQRERES